MRNFKNYIFDLGGVIADINTQNALDGFRNLGVPEEELRFDEGETAKIMQNYQLGLLSTEEFCDAIISRCKAPTGNNSSAPSPTNSSCDATNQTAPVYITTKPTRQQVADAWNTIILHIPQRKMDALRTLKQKASVYLLSNTNELHWQKCLDLWFNANGNNVQECFHHIFLSQEMHLEKPNSEIFRRALQEISEPITPENTVFLDDNLANVDAAKTCGISAIQVTPDYDWIKEILGKESEVADR